ncbi:galectin-4 [Nyctibius grandis]|uniref:galectin-4 n=1 Tax=Nyctibius grandis TaxID=48427 RepID=UPI0035BBC03B
MAFVPAPGYQPAYHPPVPYVAPVAGGLWPDMAVYVQGVVPPHADRFWVNLGGTGEGSDVALHVNPRLGGEGQAVLNSRRGGAWGQEQRRDLGPFAPGAPFELLIAVGPEGYRLLANGRPFAEFPHRLPAQDVAAVTVDGDVELHAVTVLGGGGERDPRDPPGTPHDPQDPPWDVPPPHAGESLGGGGGWGHPGVWGCPPLTPLCAPPQDVPQTIPYEQSTLPVMGHPPVLHPPVPFFATIPGGLVPKKTLVVKGFIPPDADRFHINLRAGPGGDVLLHLNPRPGEGVVVRNSLVGGVWGPEERELPHNPLQRGRYFDLSIRCGNRRFKVFAEGRPLCAFAHRLPPGPHADTLEVDGDVALSYVHF